MLIFSHKLETVKTDDGRGNTDTTWYQFMNEMTNSQFNNKENEYFDSSPF